MLGNSWESRLADEDGWSCKELEKKMVHTFRGETQLFQIKGKFKQYHYCICNFYNVIGRALKVNFWLDRKNNTFQRT